MNALEIKNLTKAFPGFVLDNLSLTLPSGCILGLIGENGAGKSTTIRLILGLLQKDGGCVTILGREGAGNQRLVREDVGVVLDEVGIPECLTTRQVGKIMGHAFRNWDQAVYEGYLRTMNLPDKKPFKDFSKGMKMKLGLAVALSHHPRLLILDEATSGLDPVARDEIVELFMEFTRDPGHSILISSHIVSDLERLCDYVAFLHKGKLLLYEEKDRLRERYGIVHMSAGDFAGLEPRAVRHHKLTPYGVEVMAAREALPPGLAFSPVSIEELFVFMVKEANRA